MKNKDKLAFPIEGETLCALGLTKREYFAAMAVQSICTNAGRNAYFLNKPIEISQKAIEMADTLLKQLEQH